MCEILIKTFDKLEFANDFLKKGAMLFSQASHFKDLDVNDARGDNTEGHVIEPFTINITENIKRIFIGDGKGKQYVLDWEAVKRDYPELNDNIGKVGFKTEYIANVLIYSITCVNSTMENIDDILKECSKFGDYSVVIYDVKDFVDKIKKLPIRQAGLVKYSDEGNKDIFVKPTKYKNEQEFRIMLNNDNNEDKKIYNIGKIKAFIWNSRKLSTIIPMMLN